MWKCKASDPSHQAINLAMTLLVWAKNPHIGTMRQDIARRSMLEPGRFEFIEFLEEGLDQLIGEKPPSSDFTDFIEGLKWTSED